MAQDELFIESEGNNWFQRNKLAILKTDRLATDHVLKIIELSGIIPRDVLEIGASNGFRLNGLREKYGCKATAIEPSTMALEDGRNRYPGIDFLQGTACHIPIQEDLRFDLVIANFVFHWVDRSTLLRSVGEIDRIITDGGYLVIGDFYPSFPVRTPYHHLPDADVWTYKQHYANVFLASNIYSLVTFLTFECGTRKIHHNVDPAKRGQVVILRKDLQQQYETVQFS